MRRWTVGLLICLLLLLRCSVCRDGPRPAPLRFATFNIENFPKSRAQVDGAFTEIRGTGASVVGVQEIVEPEVFTREARRRLGARWDFVSVDTRPIGDERPLHHIGVLFDRAYWTHVRTRVDDRTRLEQGRHKPVLEVRLRGRNGALVDVLVVHLKAGADGREIRKHQLIRLEWVAGDAVREARRAGARVVVLGDFNATDPADRDDIALVAQRAGLVWASEPLECSAFWARDDGCPRSRLDHVLMWGKPLAIEAAGACAREGCGWQPSCPVDAARISDHCPVVVTAGG